MRIPHNANVLPPNLERKDALASVGAGELIAGRGRYSRRSLAEELVKAVTLAFEDHGFGQVLTCVDSRCIGGF